jgi:hypothetical protein
VRAARLKAVKEDFAANPSLSLAALAARQGVTARYVQMLFEADGTSPPTRSPSGSTARSKC